MSMLLGGAEKMSPTFSVIIAMALEMRGARQRCRLSSVYYLVCFLVKGCILTNLTLGLAKTLRSPSQLVSSRWSTISHLPVRLHGQ